MFKGHVCIDLHNHKSGFTERIEDDNLVTGMPAKLVAYHILTSRSIPDITPIGQTLFGGLKIIDKPFEDTVNGDIFIPGNSNVIGCASYNYNNTASRLIGTFNSLESNYDIPNARYTHVWDFATTQGNGKINALGLCTAIGGKYGWSNVRDMSSIGSSGYGYSTPNMHQPLFYDEQNKDIYGLTRVSGGLKVVKIHADFFTLSLKGTSSSYTYTLPEASDVGITIENPSSWGGYEWGWQIGYDGYIYAAEINHITDEYELILHKKRISDLSFDDVTSERYVLSDYSGGYSVQNVMINKNSSNARIFVQTSDRRHIYMLTPGTSSMVDIDMSVYITDSVYRPPYLCSQTPNGDVFVFDDYYGLRGRINTMGVCVIDENIKDNSYVIPFCGKYISNGIFFGMRQNQTGYLTVLLGYDLLTTNFNLGSEIEKTVSQSMKVTYTITQV